MASVLIRFIFLAVGIWLCVQIAPGWAQTQTLSNPRFYEQVARVTDLPICLASLLTGQVLTGFLNGG